MGVSIDRMTDEEKAVEEAKHQERLTVVKSRSVLGNQLFRALQGAIENRQWNDVRELLDICESAQLI